jgi:putative ABC transport system ATP-binding protein
VIRLDDVRRVFHQGRPDELVAVDGVTLDVAAGKITVLRGPSGSGKTSLLALIGCMARPTSGRIHVGDREVTSLQQFHLVRGITALENVMLPAYPLGGSRQALVARAQSLLDGLGVGKRARARADWLSGGEAQRVAIARALVNDPEVIVADEPTAHLDSKLSSGFMEVVEALRAEGRTVVIASHDPIVHESALVDHLVSMRDGRIVSEGP